MAKPQTTDKASSPRNPAEPQPQAGASTSAYATRPTDAASSSAPTTSGRPREDASRLSGTTRRASTTAATPTGTLIQNTQRQFTWTRLPPITGPSAAPSAPSADQVPSAFGRRDRRQQQRQRRRHHRPRPGRLDDPGRDQQAHARRQPAQHRPGSKPGQPGHEQPAP